MPSLRSAPIRWARLTSVAVVALAALSALLVLCIAYPFLPGDYDTLSIPLSIMAQGFGLTAAVLVPVGVVWMAVPRLAFACAVVATLTAAAAALVLALVATLSVGASLGVLTLVMLCVGLVRALPAVSRLRHAAPTPGHPAPLYLVVLPLVSLAAQILLAGPLTTASRNRAIASAAPFIADIEQYRASHGRYPEALQAQHRDYVSRVTGVERYVYLPRGDSYNLSFEQPRFLFDRFGAREWVVYNPRDEHRVYSHTAWLMPPPGVSEPAQGWYAAGETTHPHWRSFYFD